MAVEGGEEVGDFRTLPRLSYPNPKQTSPKSGSWKPRFLEAVTGNVYIAFRTHPQTSQSESRGYLTRHVCLLLQQALHSSARALHDGECPVRLAFCARD